jgi:hypothetical protein
MLHGHMHPMVAVGQITEMLRVTLTKDAVVAVDTVVLRPNSEISSCSLF